MHEKEEIKQHMTRADMILIGICLLMSAALAVWFFLGKKDGRTLRISWEGVEIKSLSEEGKEHVDAAFEQGGTRYCLLLYTEGGVFTRWYEEKPDQETERIKTWGKSYNLVTISGGRVWMEEADCRDQLCVHHIPISTGGESIICLPNRLVVEIVDETDEERLDGMVK